MLNFHSTTSLCEQSTPVNQNRRRSSFLFANTTSTSNSFGGTTTILQTPSIEIDTKLKYEPASGIDRNSRQTRLDVKISNEFRSEDFKNNRKLSSTTLGSVLSDHKPTSTKTFSFENTQASKSATTLGISSSLFPTTNATFTFSLPQPITSSFNISSSKPTITVPNLFSTMSQPTTTSSVDLQLFQTMLNTQPFNNELAFLTRNIRPQIIPAQTSSTIRSQNNLFIPILTKPSVSSSLNRSNTILSSKPLTVSTKRKFSDSFLDDNFLTMDNDSSLTTKLSPINIKRPRMLDMNKIRSIVLGNTETMIVNSSTSENLSEWKKFDTYDEYLSSKKQDQTFHLPILTHKDYYTEPSINQLHSYFNEQGQCFVKKFTVGREHYGSVTFYGSQINLAGLDLNRLIEINRRQVTVYPDDKDRPAEGEEFNCQAQISLIGVYPIDRSVINNGEEVTDPDRLVEMDYGKYLEEMTKKFHGHFVDYDIYTGTWTFQVEHF